MKCSECIYYECALRSPMGGCPNGEKEEVIPKIIATNNSLGHDSYEKDYQPSGRSKAKQRALEAYPIKHRKVWNSAFGKISFDEDEPKREGYMKGYRQASKDIISIIESRISEILGDAQPAPVLRMELRELIDKIKNQ